MAQLNCSTNRGTVSGLVAVVLIAVLIVILVRRYRSLGSAARSASSGSAASCAIVAPSPRVSSSGCGATTSSSLPVTADGSLMPYRTLATVTGTLGPNRFQQRTMCVHHIPLDRQGIAFGIKQSAIPLATLLGLPLGALVATVAGWRAAFAFIALVAVVASVGGWVALRPNPSHTRPLGVCDPRSEMRCPR